MTCSGALWLLGRKLVEFSRKSRLSIRQVSCNYDRVQFLIVDADLLVVLSQRLGTFVRADLYAVSSGTPLPVASGQQCRFRQWPELLEVVRQEVRWRVRHRSQRPGSGVPLRVAR